MNRVSAVKAIRPLACIVDGQSQVFVLPAQMFFDREGMHRSLSDVNAMFKGAAEPFARLDDIHEFTGLPVPDSCGVSPPGPASAASRATSSSGPEGATNPRWKSAIG
jgi:hypothetical protein